MTTRVFCCIVVFFVSFSTLGKHIILKVLRFDSRG